MIALRGTLKILVNGAEAQLVAEQESIRLEVDNPVDFLRASKLFHKSNLNFLRSTTDYLSNNGLTLTVLSRDKVIMVLGHQVKSGVASSLLGVPHLEIHGAGLLRRITT